MYQKTGSGAEIQFEKMAFAAPRITEAVSVFLLLRDRVGTPMVSKYLYSTNFGHIHWGQFDSVGAFSLFFPGEDPNRSLFPNADLNFSHHGRDGVVSISFHEDFDTKW